MSSHTTPKIVNLLIFCKQATGLKLPSNTPRSSPFQKKKDISTTPVGVVEGSPKIQRSVHCLKGLTLPSLVPWSSPCKTLTLTVEIYPTEKSPRVVHTQAIKNRNMERHFVLLENIYNLLLFRYSSQAFMYLIFMCVVFSYWQF